MRTSTARRLAAQRDERASARARAVVTRACAAAAALVCAHAAACDCDGRGDCDACTLARKYARDGAELARTARALAHCDAALRSVGVRAPKIERPPCGARCRDGHACKARVVVRDLPGVPGGDVRSRCRMHGGASTGPRTVEGKAAARAALARGRATLAARRALARR